MIRGHQKLLRQRMANPPNKLGGISHNLQGLGAMAQASILTGLQVDRPTYLLNRAITSMKHFKNEVPELSKEDREWLILELLKLGNGLERAALLAKLKKVRREK